ncbi:hypothetical protein EJB05_51730 [Eragrostis curvula]|uniref:Uncharacterized protein n=1 Tax=Eragrostis curvula TaxID=38414 RepID=A0A5J9SUU0_9POAL|nr:hypothetical protein EJB05_51730 [Eragrostis curvula]
MATSHSWHNCAPRRPQAPPHLSPTPASSSRFSSSAGWLANMRSKACYLPLVLAHQVLVKMPSKQSVVTEIQFFQGGKNLDNANLDNNNGSSSHPSGNHIS